MDLGIESVLNSLLADRATRFVFPSEICAEAWLSRSLRLGLGGARSLESGRFLGWDRLKEEAARIDGRPPVDDPLRRIFAADLLAENAEDPFLSSIVPPAYAGEWQPFAGYVASRLGALARLPAALREADAAARDEAAAKDWLEVRDRYERFLRRIGRFDPAYEPRALCGLEGATVIFFPELIMDFEEYRAALDEAARRPGPSLRLVRLPRGPIAARLRKPETALAELRETLSEVGRLLDGGLRPEDIAITAAGLERYRPYLEREATLLSVPIAPRSGRNLDATEGGRLFAAIREIYSSSFSYDSLRDLLLSPAWPWKEPALGREIIAEGQRLHAVASWTEKGRKVDAWERSLSGASASWYRRLKSRISAIATANGFESLLKAYNAFRSDFLSREGWSDAANLTLARCVVELEGLARAQAESGLATSGAFGLFMRALESKPYVSSQTGAVSGVPVCEWRVAAGVFPERHFILGASQDALSVPERGFDFLGEPLRKKLGAALYRDPEAVDRDAAPDFIRAYALSGSSVSFSCPDSGWDGAQTAHGFLVSMSNREEAEPTDGAYREEASWLSGRGPAPRRLHRVQATGISAAARAQAVSSGEGAFLDPETAAAAFARLARPRRGQEGDARPSLDSTAIDSYHACPYAYLYLRLLEAGPEPSGITFVDALFLGDVYHAALALMFERVREVDGRFKPERVDAYRGLVAPCLGEAFARLARSRGAFVAVVLEAYRGRLEGYLSRLLDAEAVRFAGLEVGPIEEEFELPYPDVAGGVVLRGRIDRISRSDRGAVVVDYKKGMIPDRRSVAPDDSGAIAEAQIPCYLRLAAASGEQVDSAWYVTIEGHERRAPGQAVCAFGGAEGGAPGRDGGEDPYVPREGLEPLLAAFDGALERTAGGIAAGAFPLAPKETQRETCRDCGARGICRERYALRFEASKSVRSDPLVAPGAPGGRA